MKKILQSTSAFTVGDLREHRRLCRAFAGVAAFLMVTTTAAPALAAGTVILGGDATLTSATRASLNVGSATDSYAQFVATAGAKSAVLDWSKFDIGTDKVMDFSGSGTTFFNLVNSGASKSQIDGLISAGVSDSVWVINPAGVAFGAGAQVNVGGLFAAAAGNISNADALRSGSATQPTFSSFEGAVETKAGATFTADQVALMGKTVSAAGDFTGANALTIGAASGAMTVDDVGGGKVSVNLGDFTVADAEVSLGDLDVGGPLSVKSCGDLAVNADVDAYQGVSAQAIGNVCIAADVTSRGGATGTDGVTLYSSRGNVVVNQGAKVSSAGSVDMTAGLGNGVKGDVVVKGSVVSSSGGVSLYSGYGRGSTGDISIDGEVSAATSVDAYAGFGYALGTAGNLTVNGSVTGVSSVNLRTGNGDIKIGADAVVKATGSYSEVNVYTAADAGYGLMTGEGHKGDIIVDGTISANTAWGLGMVNIVAGKEEEASGSVTLNGTVSADYYAQLGTRTGDVTINGRLDSNAEATVSTHNGNITVGENGEITGRGSYEAYGIAGLVNLYAAMDSGSKGDVQVSGKLTAGGQSGRVVVDAGYNAENPLSEGGAGSVTVTGSVVAGGGLSSYGDSVTLTQDGSVSLNDIVAVKGDASISTAFGDITVRSGGTVSAEKGSVKLQSAQNASAAGGWLEIGEGAAVSGKSVYLGVGTDYGRDPFVGDIGYNATGGKGDLNIEGTVTGSERVMVGTSYGSIAIGKNGKISTKSSGAELDVESGVAVGGVGQVTIDGTIDSAGAAYLSTASGGSGLGDIEITENGSVKAVGNAYLYAGQGNIDWTTYSLLESFGDVFVKGSIDADSVDIQAGYNLGYGKNYGYGEGSSQVSVGASGRVNANGTLGVFGVDRVSHDGVMTGKGLVSIGAWKGIQGNGSVSVEGGTLDVSGGISSISLTGAIKAKDATFTARTVQTCNDIIVNNIGNDFMGTVTAHGNNIQLTDANDLTLNTINALGNLTVQAGGSIGQTASGSVKACQKNTSVTLNATGDIALNNEANNFERVSATGEDISLSDNGYIVLDRIKATRSLKVTAKTQVVSEADSVVDVSGGQIELSGKEIAFSGLTLAKDVNLTAQDVDGTWGNVNMSNEKNDITGVARVNGGSAFIRTAHDISLGDITTHEGSAMITSDGGISVHGQVEGKDLVSLVANGGNVEVGTGGVPGSVKSETVVLLNATSQTGLKGNVVVGENGLVSAQNRVHAFADAGSVTVAEGGRVEARGTDGSVLLSSATKDESTGDVKMEGFVGALGSGGSVSIMAGTGNHAKGNADVSGTVVASGFVLVEAGSSVDGKESSGNVRVDGFVNAGTLADVVAADGNVAVGETGRVTGDQIYLATGLHKDAKGDISVAGTVVAGKEVFLMAGVDESASGNLRFEGKGLVAADEGVYAIVKNGNLTQSGNNVAIAKGRAQSENLRAAMSADTINIVVKNGSIGSESSYVAVKGKTFAHANGNVFVGAANGANFKGGPGVGTKDTTFGTITFGDPNGNSNIKAEGDIAVYTAGKIESSGLLQADGNLTVTASSFDDVSYLRAGGTLTINNVGKPAYPQIAYFESVDGVEPKINNQPNDTVIFVDGRLAGGNLKILNQFGANEAFLVATPELKSTQGIFGNPLFLHSDLDVANPMEVGTIDYMLQETPRLTLDKDFPQEVDQHVDSVVIPEKDSIQFGRSVKAESDEQESEGDVAETVPLEGNVALLK